MKLCYIPGLKQQHLHAAHLPSEAGAASWKTHDLSVATSCAERSGCQVSQKGACLWCMGPKQEKNRFEMPADEIWEFLVHRYHRILWREGKTWLSKVGKQRHREARADWEFLVSLIKVCMWLVLSVPCSAAIAVLLCFSQIYCWSLIYSPLEAYFLYV